MYISLLLQPPPSAVCSDPSMVKAACSTILQLLIALPNPCKPEIHVSLNSAAQLTGHSLNDERDSTPLQPYFL